MQSSRVAQAGCIVIGLLAISGFAGCALEPSATYDLTAAGPGLASKAKARGTLAVQIPTATLLLDSQRIAIKTGSELAYLKGAQWSAQLPFLIQKRLTESFENSHTFASVIEPQPDAQYTLQTDIRHFEADVTHSAASVEIYVRLLGAAGQIIADHNFTAAAFAPRDDGTAISKAIDEALGQVLRQIVIWTALKA